MALAVADEHEGQVRVPRGKWRPLVRKELGYLGASLRNGFLGGGALAGGGAFLLCLYTLWSDPKFSDQRVTSFLVAAGYALYLGTIAGAALGIAMLAWRAVRGWILVPLVLIPATLWLAVWLSSGLLAAQFVDVLGALVQAARGRTLLIDGLGHAAHAGPIVLVIALPLLVVDVGILALQPSVLWQIAILAAEVSLVLAIGTIPGALVSIAALGVAYVRGFRRRYGAESPPV